jgi:hypothetical protein
MSAAAPGDQLLHSAIGSHDLFFAQIISMIPRDLYKPEEEDGLISSHSISIDWP